jgi:hypothetical protein
MAKKQMMKYSTFLVIKEMLIKIMFRFHLTPVRMTNILTGKNVGKVWGKRNPQIMLVGM